MYKVSEISEMVYSVSPRLEAEKHIIAGLQPTTKYKVCVTIGNSIEETSLKRSVTTSKGIVCVCVCVCVNQYVEN